MQPCDIAISYESGLFDERVEKLKRNLDTSALNIRIEKREPAGPMAGVEWLMLTGAAIYIAKSYFDGFLKEAGKEHYQIIKDALSSFTKETMESPRIEPIIIGTLGKVRKDNPYSMALSIYAEANDGKRFKLLIPKLGNDCDYTKVVHKFLDFLISYHQGISVISDTGFDESSRGFERLILVHYNSENNRIEWVDYRKKA